MNQYLPRLLYLANELRPQLPSAIAKFVPQGDLIATVATIGITGAIQALQLEPEQLESLIDEGASKGRATLTEWKHILTNLAVDNLIENRDEMTTAEFIRRNELVNSFLNSNGSIIQVLQTDWDDPDAKEVVKWDSGLSYLDPLMEGFYHGLFIYMASTGVGKTSLLLSMVEALKKLDYVSEVWFFQTEIPRDMFQYRIRPLKKRGVQFAPGRDQIFYGQMSMLEILEMINARPDPNRVIIYDSPDVLASSADDNRRFELERIYRDLVIIKNLSKAVFVASQMSRKDSSPKITSVSESWAKAWYADGIIGFKQMGVRGTSALMKAAILKNRFGPAGIEMTFNYDLVDLLGTTDSASKKKAIGWESSDNEW